MLRNLGNTCRQCLQAGCHQQQARNFHVAGSLYKKLSDFQLRKITQEFDHIYDNNRDGYIDKKDVTDFKRRIRNYVSHVQGQAAKEAYKVAYEDYWTIMMDAVDTDRDGKVSRDAWISLWEKILDGADGSVSFESLPQWVRIMPRGIFPAMDWRGDGKLDADEYRDFWHHVGKYPLIDNERLSHIFQVLTEDGKYDLDVKRIEDLYGEFYLSNDHNSPGRYVAGPMDFEYTN